MATIQLIGELTPTPTAGGVWTYTGTTTPNPAPPIVSDGTIDFAGYANGNYEYTYTVTPVLGCNPTSSTVTVALNTGIPMANDNCGSTFINVLSDGTSDTVANQNFAGECPGNLPATDSGVAIASNWGSGVYVDGWYRLDAEVTAASATLTIEVTSSPYPSGEQLINPVIAVYTGTCGSLVEDGSNGVFGSTVNVYQDVLTTGAYTFYVRVATASTPGKFTINYFLQ